MNGNRRSSCRVRARHRLALIHWTSLRHPGALLAFRRDRYEPEGGRSGGRHGPRRTPGGGGPRVARHEALLQGGAGVAYHLFALPQHRVVYVKNPKAACSTVLLWLDRVHTGDMSFSPDNVHTENRLPRVADVGRQEVAGLLAGAGFRFTFVQPPPPFRVGLPGQVGQRPRSASAHPSDPGSAGGSGAAGHARGVRDGGRTAGPTTQYGSSLAAAARKPDASPDLVRPRRSGGDSGRGPRRDHWRRPACRQCRMCRGTSLYPP